MPIREYSAVDAKEGCRHCNAGFEEVEPMDASPLKTCPRCGGAVERNLSSPRLGISKSGLDDRAKQAGFSKLKKLGNGEYEKKY